MSDLSYDQIDALVDVDPIALRDVAWKLTQDVARLEAERDEARVDASILTQQLDDSRALCHGHVDGRDLERAQAERDAMRPVVEAAKAFRDATAIPTNSMAEATERAGRLRPIRAALLAAVDQTTPSSPLETPHAADGGEAGVVEGAGGSEAAEGSHMDCPERCEVPAGVRIVETPPSRHAWSDVVRCPNNGCEKTFLVIRDGKGTDG